MENTLVQKLNKDINRFLLDEDGMEFIDVAIIVIGSVAVLSAIIVLTKTIWTAVNSTKTDIPNYSKLQGEI